MPDMGTHRMRRTRQAAPSRWPHLRSLMASFSRVGESGVAAS